MDAYVFGKLGNAQSTLGPGWSVEDEFAWAIGGESLLTLPLPGDEADYTLRFDIHPALFPSAIERQRLIVETGETALASFGITARGTIAIPLPADVTRGKGRLELLLLHPDAARPRDHLSVSDSRRLALCFHSATLMRTAMAAGTFPADRAGLEPVHGLIAGDGTAKRLGEIIGKLPCLKGKFGLRFIDFAMPLDQALAGLPPDALASSAVCWTEASAGNSGVHDRLHQRLPAGCRRRVFHAPTMQALWPFRGQDARAVAEPGRYERARFCHGDRLAQPLASMNMPDDVVYLMYDMSAEQEPIDLHALFAADLARWRVEDAASDMRLCEFIEGNISSSRLFVSPNLGAPALLRRMVEQMLDDPVVRHIVPPEVLIGELDTLLEGYAGWQEELPVHKRVAAHFGLAWWSPEMKYCWMNNHRTYREYVLDTIRWVQWRP